jgi:cAMP-binding proteins - catabolite gene activator and regulatory subunit of cAMP-dependent protein kinases
MANFPVHTYSKGQVIFEQGTPGEIAYIIKTGTVQISVESPEGKLVLAELQPGAIFGEMALVLKDNKRTAKAVALEDLEAIAIYKNYFMDYLKETPMVIVTLLTGLIERLQETTSRLTKSSRLTAQIEEVLHLLNNHGVEAIKYNETVETFCRFAEMEPSVIQDQLEHIETLGHIQISTDKNDHKVITLPFRKL